jgi:hypothetical protein
MTIESRKLESATEFLKLRGLEAEFDAFHQDREQTILDEAKPKFEIMRGEHSSRRGNCEEYANITPWLRKATVEEIQRLLSIVPDNLPDVGEEDNDDVKFLDQIWYSLPEPDFEDFDDDDDWTRSYCCYFRIDLAEFTAVIQKVNPTAYRHLLISPEELGQVPLPQ